MAAPRRSARNLSGSGGRKPLAAKARIAAKLTALVPRTGAVAFDASSTVMRLVGMLGDARDLSVLTNGPDTFNALQGIPGVIPLLTGGHLELRTGSLVGPLACRTATQFRVGTFFTSAAAVHPQGGALEATLEEAEVKRCIAAGAKEVVLAVDASKLSDQAVAVALEWEQVDVLVTDLDPSDRRLKAYRGLGAIAVTGLVHAAAGAMRPRASHSARLVSSITPSAVRWAVSFDRPWTMRARWCGLVRAASAPPSIPSSS